MCLLWPTSLTFKHVDYRINHKPEVWETSRELKNKVPKGGQQVSTSVVNARNYFVVSFV